jgi:mycothiol synthase
MNKTISTRQSTLSSQLTWRPATLEDAPAVYELYQAMDVADGTNWAGTLEGVLQDFHEETVDLARDTLLGVNPQGQIIALGWVFPRSSDQKQVAFLWGGTHPDYRRKGLGNRVMKWLDQQGAAQLLSLNDERERLLRVQSPDYLADRIALYQRMRYILARSFFRMRRMFDTPIPEPAVPAGYKIIPWLPKINPAIKEALDESFRDHWGHIDWTEAQWQDVLNNPTFRQQYSFLAMAGEEVAGVCLNRVITDEVDRTGIKEGWIGSLGVRRPYRKLGLGSALLCTSMRAFEADGYVCAGLGVDTESPTGALGIYERMGFHPIRRDLTFIKTVELK